MFSSKHCPLLQRRLSLFMKLMYCSGVWSYIVGALTTPTYILIPILTVYAGIFPIVVSWWAAGAQPFCPLSASSLHRLYRIAVKHGVDSHEAVLAHIRIPKIPTGFVPQ